MDFKAKYDRNTFVDFFSNSLLPEDFEATIETVEPDFKSKYFQSVTYLGQSPSLDLNIYEIRHTSEKDARVGLSRDAFKLVSRYGANNALILFVPENPDNFRLSLVTIEPKLDDKGVKILKEYSNPRRYSFVLGDDAKTHTPEQYLIALGRIADNADLTKRFSVEVVNKDFYGQIAEMFSKLVGGQRKMGNRTVDYQRQLALPSVSTSYEQKYKEFAVRLIGRTVFCWFLKKKKSDKGVPLIHNDVLSRFAADFTPNFYHARVEPLFFEVLNTSIEKRKSEYKKDPFDKIPFLNGGLFEPHLDDFYKVNHVTGTSEYLNTVKIPDDWWKELLDILETYNFTIDENTSIDIDLSVDPEMLGRIFENLLAEINPETGDTARKATGSYYTPRPIVEYMVDQSLKQYLVTKTAFEETKFDILLDYSDEASGLSEAEEKSVIEALNTIKVLDPACGSGAFPMGMLQKMLLILQKVDHNAQNSVQQILNEITDPIKRELIKRKLEAAQVLDDVDFDDYARKLNVIQRSIYGVDIQPIATDISKLRFFLSLVVDEVIQDEAPNRGIEPLPNLEFKFVCANTLIPLPEADNFEKMFGDAELVSGLENIRTRYFTASNDDKPTLKNEFEGIQKQLYDFLNQHGAGANITKSRFGLLATWKPFSDEAATWFDPKWMFGVDSGFNIVIGNPPYIPLPKISIIEKNIYSKLYDCATGRFNLFYLFIENASLIANSNGLISYIVPDRLLLNTQLKDLRSWLLSNNTILSILSFDENVFDNAVVDNVIISFIPKASDDFNIKVKHKTSFTNLFNNDYLNIPTTFFKSSQNTQFYLEYSPIKDIIFNKIRDNSVVLSEIADTRDGIIQSKIGDELFLTDKIDDDSKKLLFGKDITKFAIKYSGNWVNYKPELMKRLEGERNNGIINMRMRNSTIFERPKILTRQTADCIIAAFDDNNFYYANTLHGTHILNKNYQNFYVLAVLNSKLITWYYQSHTDEKGKVFAQIKIELLTNLPIPIANNKEQLLIVKIVEKIMRLRELNDLINSIRFENIIDLLIYKLTKLTYDEIMLIDSEIQKIINFTDYEKLDFEGLAKYKIA